MANGRHGFIEHESGTPYGRHGVVAYSDISTRLVEATAGVPGTASHRVNLGGNFDANGKTAVLVEGDGVTEVALTLTAQTAAYIEFTVPTPWADGSSFDMFDMGAYTLRITDGSGDVDGTFSFTAPSQPTYWYYSAITGSPWGQDSIFYQSTGLSDGDSVIVEVTENGPAGAFQTLNSDGTFVLYDSTNFRVKGYNADGWSTSWATWSIQAEGTVSVGATPGTETGKSKGLAKGRTGVSSSPGVVGGSAIGTTVGQ